MKHVAVALAGFALGGWAVPLGFVLGLGPLATFVASAIGGLLGCWIFLALGDRFSEWLGHLEGDRRGKARARPADDPADREPQKGRDQLQRLVDRYGVRGLGLVGPIFPGVTASVVGGMALGLDRRSLARWMTIGIIGMYGLYTVGLSILF